MQPVKLLEDDIGESVEGMMMMPFSIGHWRQWWSMMEIIDKLNFTVLISKFCERQYQEN